MKPMMLPDAQPMIIRDVPDAPRFFRVKDTWYRLDRILAWHYDEDTETYTLHIHLDGIVSFYLSPDEAARFEALIEHGYFRIC